VSKRDIDLIKAKLKVVRPYVNALASIEDLGKTAVVNIYLNELLAFIEQLEEGKIPPFYIKQLLGEK